METPELSVEAPVEPIESVKSIESVEPIAPVATEPKPSYVKLAMRNMVRKRGKSLQHFALTATALLGLLVGLSYLTR